MKLSTKRSIRLKISLYFTLGAVLLVNVIGWTFYLKSAEYFERGLDEHLIAIANTASHRIDSELLDFIDPGEEKGEFYQTLQHSLIKLRDDFKVLRVYILDKSYRILIDSDTSRAIGSLNLRSGLDDYELSKVRAGLSRATTLYADNAGVLVKSAYAPISTRAGKLKAIAAVDASPGFLAVIGEIRARIIMINIATLALSIILSLFFANLIVNPLNKLVAATLRIKSGNLDIPVTGLPPDEIGYLGDVFNSMQSQIRENEDRLNHLREQAEIEASSVQNYNEYILQSINNGIITVDLSGRIEVFNTRAKDLLNIETARVGDDILEIIPHRETLSSIVAQSHKAPEQYDIIELTYGKGAAARQFSISISPLRMANEEIIGINYVITDMTRIHMLQKQVEEKERLAYLGELSATIAHEIRNPLNSMELFLGLLKREVGKRDSHASLVQKVSDEIQHLNEIVSSFLQFAKPPDLQLELTEIDEIIEDVLGLAEGQITAKNGIVEIAGSAGLRCKVDPHQMKQAILNLVLNSIDAIRSHGKIRITKELIQHVNQPELIQIVIEDNGMGVDPNYAAKIFEPFYSKKSMGTGLGLSIVKSIVNAHRGEIALCQGTLNGAAFQITLPVSGVSE